MKRAGRANWIAILGLIGAVILVAMLFLGSESPSAAANKFMSALARRDVNTLTRYTYLGEAGKDEIQKKWEASTEIARYYRFSWQILGELQADEKTASVRMNVWRNVDSPSPYEDRYDLALIKVSGRWLVDVRGISREMYPALPR